MGKLIRIIVLLVILGAAIKLMPPEHNIVVKLLCNRAVFLAEEGDFDSAIKFANYALLIRPDAKHVSDVIATINRAGARKKSTPVTIKAPDKQYNLALSYYRVGDYATSIQLFSEMIAAGTNDPEVYYYRGLSYFQNMDIARATVDVEKCLALDSGHEYARISLENIYHEKAIKLNRENSNIEALAFLKKAIALDPDDKALLYSHASVLRDLAQYDEALKDYKHLSEIWPENGYIHIDMMGIYQFLGMQYRAEEEAKIAISILEGNSKVAPSVDNRIALSAAYKVLGDNIKADILVAEAKKLERNANVIGANQAVISNKSKGTQSAIIYTVWGSVLNGDIIDESAEKITIDVHIAGRSEGKVTLRRSEIEKIEYPQ